MRTVFRGTTVMHAVLLVASLLSAVAVIAMILVPLARGRAERGRSILLLPLCASLALAAYAERGNAVTLVCAAVFAVLFAALLLRRRREASVAAAQTDL
jgi:hypothetical protein